MAALPRFDFSLNLDLVGELNSSQDSGPKSAKDKDAKRLARCGKCNNCKSQDCGSCYNCADKPKFGGPGIKKQACINRKCLLMVPRDEEGEKMARKRSKQRSGPNGGMEVGTGGMRKPFAVPTGFGTQSFNTGRLSPPSSPDEEESASLDGERDSPLTIGETESLFAPPPNAYGLSGPVSTRMDPVEPATTGLTPAQTGLTPYFSTGLPATDELPALFGEFVLPPNRREAPAEFPRLDDKINAGFSQRDLARDWSWTNPTLLMEEFILMNDLHRRASAQPSSSIAAF